MNILHTAFVLWYYIKLCIGSSDISFYTNGRKAPSYGRKRKLMQNLKEQKQIDHKEAAFQNAPSAEPSDLRIRDLPEELRPYEKCEAFGAAALSDAELIAVILRSGSRGKNSVRLSEELLCLRERKNGLLNLMYLSEKELLSLKGVGRVKALQICCIGELSRRIWKQEASRGLDVRSAASVADYYMEDLRHLDYECIYLMLLDTRDNLQKSVCVSRGSIHGACISPREILSEALRYRACSFILVHNHPSGDPLPSKADRELTAHMEKAGLAIGIPLLDHVIIGDNRYFSFLEKGLLSNGK